MNRLHILRLCIVLLLLLLVGRLYQLQLMETESRRYGSDSIRVTTTRYLLVAPRRGEILARDGQTILAESVPIFNVAVLPGGLPSANSPRRDEVLGELVQLVGITSTLTFSPSLTMPTAAPGLRRALDDIDLALPRASAPLTLSVPPAHTLAALQVTQRYSDVLRLNNPVDALLVDSSASGYKTVVVQEDVSQALALAVYENSTYLPGVVVVEDYRRIYPHSAGVPSLSHTLGYIGRINQCELVAENPANSWLESFVDVVSHVGSCGVLGKQIIPSAVGTPLYRNDDRIGKDGLEGSYEDVLRGTLGVEMIGVDALERPVSAARTLQPVYDGNNLMLTVDLPFQQQVEGLLRRWLDESERRRLATNDHRREYQPITNGAAVVLDANTGAVRALVSLPSYDNNVWVEPDRSAELQALLSPADPEERAELVRLAPLTNRVLAGRYPAGSTLKPFVGATALQQRIIAPDTALRDPGRIVLQERSGQTFVLPNSTPQDRGEITLAEALRISSNVFFAVISGGNLEATNLGADYLEIRGMKIGGMAEGLGWFGFGQPTGIPMPGETRGRVPDPNWKSHALREPWTTGDTYNTSIGQGYLEVTPLQLATAMGALANGGTIYRPQLVEAITDSSGNVLQTITPEEQGRLPIDPAYLTLVREGIRRSVTDGANVAARDSCSGLAIAGKTGTAEFGPNIVLEDGAITRQSHSWFVGFAPYDNPEVVVVVLLEGTGDLNDGSATLAVPAVTQIMQAYFGVNPPAERPPDCPLLPGDAPAPAPDAPAPDLVAAGQQ